MKNKSINIFLICLLIFFSFTGTGHAKTASSDEISITIPQNLIINFIRTALPLNLETGPHLKGDLWIQVIDHIKIGPGKVEFEMVVQGKNLKFETHLGSKIMLLDIGGLNAAFSCDASIRYDAAKRLLFITPNIIQKPNQYRADPFAANLLQMLSLANGTEYPVEIKKFQPFVTRIGKDSFNIDINISRIFIERGAIVIQGRPEFIKMNHKL